MSETSYRSKCLSEKGEKCSVCGNEENIEVHHIDGDRSNDSLENLAPLCESHHRAVHRGDEEVQQLVDKLPERTIDEKMKVSISIDSDMYHYLEEWADNHHSSFSGAVREHIEFAMEAKDREEAGTGDLLKQRVEMLEDQVAYLRETLRESVSK